MNYRKILTGILGILLLAGSLSCKKTFDKLLTNPNFPSPSTADVDLYLNEVQLDFISFWATTGDYGAQLSRQQHWTGPFYRNGYTPASFDGQWTTAYTGVFTNTNALIPLAQSQRKYFQSGVARVLKAFTLGTLVDNFGDIPYTEANLGNENTVPKVDAGATTYAAVQTLLDSAISDFGKTGAATFTGTDLYYGGNKANWLALAKTLKLKFYMQSRLVDNTAAAKIQALITENALINSAAQDFTFRYGTSVTSPDSRHPHYATDYTNTGNGEYLSNYYMWLIGSQKYGGAINNTTGDPRLRYYFYRQVGNYSWATASTAPCFAKSQAGIYPSWYPSVPDKTPFCTVGKGYHGRDHGDNSGAPPDGSYITAWGVYPAGGQFDADQFKPVSLGLGGQGAGIAPIWLSSFTSFLEAEAVLSLGVTAPGGTAKTLFTSGISASIDKVLAFPATVNVTPPASFVPSAAQKTNYLTLVSNNYDTATTNDGRLNMVMSEYFIALWGNGVESYNNLRRTAKPANIQLAVAVPNPGFFMYSYFYPSVFVNRNSNAPAQKDPGNAVQKVFWDNTSNTAVK
ncbi:MAG: SusD/RagB family nutrient-binding outer membrane lipoprotein [Bacteroidota bacterium]